MAVNVQIVTGDLLDQRVDAIVNAWNRNILPWWLLLPHGVSAAIKRRAGLAPFQELARRGPIPLGDAVLTGPGNLPYRGIIHVAGINLFWAATERSIFQSVCSAVSVAMAAGYQSIAMPIIGAGAGGMQRDRAETIIRDTLASIDGDLTVKIVRFGSPDHNS